MNENLPTLSTGQKLNPLAASISGMPPGISGVNANISAMYPNAIGNLGVMAGLNAPIIPGSRTQVIPNVGLNYQNGGFNASVNRSMGQMPMTNADIRYTRNF